MADKILTCSYFFDGDELCDGPIEIAVGSDGTVASIGLYTGSDAVASHLISPGLVDLQLNGYNTVDVMTANLADLAKLDREMQDLGVTSWLGTIVSAPLKEMAAALDKLHHIVVSRKIRGLKGLHVEGPFLGKFPGAHRTSCIAPIDLDFLDSLSPQSVRMVTLAPEQQGVIEAIKLLRSKGIVVSLGHAAPTESEYLAAVSAGASSVTHIFNGMSGISHRSDPGLALLALTDDRVTYGCIADMVHVNPYAVRLAFQGRTTPYLISDAFSWASPAATTRGFSKVKEDGGLFAVRQADGMLIGSATALNVCVHNAAAKCGVPLQAALRAATSVPADLIGLNAGRIKVGTSVRDVVMFDWDMQKIVE